MKTLSVKTMSYKSVSKFLSLATVALVAVLAMTGCGSKKGNAAVNNPYGYGYGAGCTTCVNGGNVVAQATGVSAYGEQFMLSFYGQGATAPGYGQSYSGPVQAGGTLNVAQNSIYSCGLAAGQYVVETMQPGAWRGQSFGRSLGGSLILRASGPTLVQIEFVEGWVNAVPGSQAQYRLFGNMIVTGQNGARCQISI